MAPSMLPGLLPLPRRPRCPSGHRYREVRQLAQSIFGRRRTAVGVLVAGVALLSTAALTGAFAGTSSTTQVNTARQHFAQHILKTQAARLMSWPTQGALPIP